MWKKGFFGGGGDIGEEDDLLPTESPNGRDGWEKGRRGRGRGRGPEEISKKSETEEANAREQEK